ncbi:hypothetical protein [Leisingera sp. NJS204]|uniref:hypothetical protein n=1 Tax=Leisingera sp. NJS204 TaxID=2508307 RepID=UPI00101164AC|nr:hypothetical protein [Leisingera sp. NJS204]QAX32118.1 hypothetical protein ETW24_22290 [Leisingera sp. NJS204]
MTDFSAPEPPHARRPATAGQRGRRGRLTDLLAAAAVVAVMALLSWILAGAPGTNGIDDAAITRSYSENIANGHGFVYNIGGERVEGATSFLWTLILAVPYLGGGNPETAILLVAAGFTVAAVWFGLRIARRAGGGPGSPEGTAAAALSALALCGLPSFFIWSVWSMMEIALWTALILLLLDRLSQLAEGAAPPHMDLPLLLAAAALPLTRPEGIAVAAGLGLLAIVLRPAAWRPAGLAVVAAITGFAALTLGRMAYFGFPFPNTYYAKVSADRLQNVLDGAKYFISFLTGQPFAEVLVPAWLLLAAVSIIGLIRRPAPGQRTRVLAAAAVFGILFSYVMLGGDHFALWRFYQPVMPILALPLVLGGLALLRALQPVRRATAVGLGLAALLVWSAVNAIAYRQERFRIAREFTLSARGEVFGTYMNGFSPRPSMGVAAAGGIALTYGGELRDLMGLNWVEMAHANPIKTGLRNHASFDADTFWKHPPDLLPRFHKPGCQRHNWTEAVPASGTGVKQLFLQPRFRAEYTPVVLEMDGGACTNAFAANSWLAQVESSRIVPAGWDAVTLTGGK